MGLSRDSFTFTRRREYYHLGEARSTGSLLSAGDIWNEKAWFNPVHCKPGQNAEAILKTFKLFIYGDIHDITN
jgi:hypothetical protein